LSVWKLFSKNSFLLQSQGVSLSIADAKVDTFNLTTKQTSKFFRGIFKGFLQMADLQDTGKYTLFTERAHLTTRHCK